GALHGYKAGKPPCQRILYTGCRHLSYFRALDGSHGSRVGQLLRRPIADDDDLVDILAVGLENNFQFLGAPDEPFLCGIAYTAKYHNLATPQGQAETSIVARLYAALASSLRDGHAGKGAGSVLNNP